MTKLTFDVDFTKDPEEILREIQEQAKQEVAKRESKEKANAYLANLHNSVNEEIGTSYKSTDDLIRALYAFSKSGSIRTSSAKVSATGRRVTISMTQEIFDEIKSKLSQPNPNKAAIARETGVSVVQVRKVATGGFDSKFGGGTPSTPKPQPKPIESPSPIEPKTEPVSIEPEPSGELPKLSPNLPDIVESSSQKEKLSLPSESKETEEAAPLAPPPAPSLDLPPLAPAPPAPETPTEEPLAEELPSPPSFGEEFAEEPAPIAPPPVPSLDLPPLAPVPPAPEAPAEEAVAEEIPAPPSFGEELAEEPAPLAPPPVPSFEMPPAPPTQAEEELAPPAPPSPPTPSGVTRPPLANPTVGLGKPSLTLKPKSGPGGNPGKPSLSLKSGKKKPTTLKITRPPMRPPSA